MTACTRRVEGLASARWWKMATRNCANVFKEHHWIRKKHMPSTLEMELYFWEGDCGMLHKSDSNTLPPKQNLLPVWWLTQVPRVTTKGCLHYGIPHSWQCPEDRWPNTHTAWCWQVQNSTNRWAGALPAWWNHPYTPKTLGNLWEGGVWQRRFSAMDTYLSQKGVVWTA